MAATRRTVLVTGAANGIGAATAVALADRDTTLVLGDLSPTVEQVAAALDEHLAGEVVAVRGDVTHTGYADELVARAGSPIDVVVAAAGVVQRRSEVADTSDDEWQRVLGVNLTGAFLLCRAVAPHLRRPGGRVVLVASILARGGRAGYAAYAASKAGLVAFSHALAEELAPDGITVNTVAPGYIDTQMGREAIASVAAVSGASYERTRDRREAAIPLGRLGTAEEVAATIAFLCSPAASYVTGASIDVNGGVLLR